MENYTIVGNGAAQQVLELHTLGPKVCVRGIDTEIQAICERNRPAATHIHVPSEDRFAQRGLGCSSHSTAGHELMASVAKDDTLL